jgi:thioredoxin 1
MFSAPSFYSPVALRLAQLQPGETHYSSFLVQETEKQRMGYQPQSTLTYLCHVTDQRLIFEAQADTNVTSSAKAIVPQVATAIADTLAFQISLDAIATFKVVRSLNLTAYAQIILKSTPASLQNHPIVFAVNPAPQRGMAHKSENCAGAFVGLGKDLLTGAFGQMSQPNPAEVARFKEAIASSDLPVVVGFSATGCHPCQVFEPVVVDVTQQFNGRLTMIKVNVEQEPGIPMEYGVDCFPTLMLFKNGQAIETITGAVPKVVLTKVLSKLVVA